MLKRISHLLSLFLLRFKLIFPMSSLREGLLEKIRHHLIYYQINDRGRSIMIGTEKNICDIFNQGRDRTENSAGILATISERVILSTVYFPFSGNRKNKAGSSHAD
jgi:hypothetical protein